VERKFCGGVKLRDDLWSITGNRKGSQSKTVAASLWDFGKSNADCAFERLKSASCISINRLTCSVATV
jgi:hypothetical protein